MDELDFTAGVTLHDDRVVTVDVTAIDGSGLTYRSDDGTDVLAWSDIKAVMLATTDHMIESGGYLFSMAERVEEHERGEPSEAQAMRRFGLRLLREAAPRICPLAEGCGLRAADTADGAAPKAQ